MPGLVTGDAWLEFVKDFIFKMGIETYDHSYIYRTRINITRSWSVTALLYKPRILGLKNEEIPFVVHKLSVI